MSLKIGVMKIGANITQSPSILTASNFDMFSLLPILAEQNHSIHIFTAITRNTIIKKPYKLHDSLKVESLNKLDILLIFNGPINFFGGNEDRYAMKQYELINEFKGRIIYVMTDSRYPFCQLWPLMILKEWHKKYSHEKMWVTNPNVQYLYQGRDINKLLTVTNKGYRKVHIKAENVLSFPIDWAIMLNNQEVSYESFKPFELRKYELMYGGSNRDRNRANRFDEYFNTNVFKTKVFGSIKLGEKANPNGAVPHRDFIRTMSESLATVIIGDKFYENNFFTLRMYESILAGCLTFIDERFDKSHSFYGADNEMLSILYVNNAKELRNKLDWVKREKMFYKIIEAQLERIKEIHNPISYKNKFIGLIEGNL